MEKIKLVKSDYDIKEEGQFTRYLHKKEKKKSGIRLTSKFKKEFELVDASKKPAKSDKDE